MPVTSNVGGVVLSEISPCVTDASDVSTEVVMKSSIHIWWHIFLSPYSNISFFSGQVQNLLSFDLFKAHRNPIPPIFFPPWSPIKSWGISPVKSPFIFTRWSLLLKYPTALVPFETSQAWNPSCGTPPACGSMFWWGFNGQCSAIYSNSKTYPNYHQWVVKYKGINHQKTNIASNQWYGM